MKSINFLDIKFSLGTYHNFIDSFIDLAKEKRSSYACVAGVHILYESHQDPGYAEIIKNADIVTPDGEPITWALRWLFGIRQERVAGMDLLPDLLAAAEKAKVSVAFYGGTQTTLDRSKEFMIKKYPELVISKMYSPPFRQLTESEEAEVVKMFEDSGAMMIFVVLGCPKQEKWMYSKRNKIHSLMIGIGGALPVLIGQQKRAPRWMQKAGMEWFFRLMQEPRRLFRRYATANSLFLYLVMKEKLSFRKKIPTVN